MWPLLVLFSCGSRPPAPEVLIITVDTLRADRLGFAGHVAAHTPALDGLASTGRAFLGATTPLPRTTPALASLHTGLPPYKHGSREVGTPITVDATLAAALANAGWQTRAISAMQVAGPEQRLDVGFQAFEVRHDARAADIAARALEMVADADPSTPLLLWVHFADPHFPYLPPEDGPLKADGGDCRSLGESAAASTLRRVELFTDRDGMATRALSGCQALYDAEIASVDAAVGALLEGFRSRRGDDGWVVFTADHGENQGEAGLWFEHGPNVHDASLRVPLVVAGPGVVAGVDEGIARLEDIHPTVLAWAGVPPGDVDGFDLAPRLRGGLGPPAFAVAESGSALHAPMVDAVVSGRAKRRSCVNGERFSLCRTPKGVETLHDHVADPGLTQDVSASHPESVELLRAAAARWPPESARQRTARTHRFKLVGTPLLAGGYQWSLYDLQTNPEETTDVSALHAPQARRLRREVEALGPLPPGAQRDEELEAALRALGYLD